MLGYENNIKIVNEIFLDVYLKDIFTQKFNLTKIEVIDGLKSPNPKLTNFLEEVYNEILSSKLTLSKEPGSKPNKQIKEKRLSIKEITERTNNRGHQSDIDRAMIKVNELENIVAKLQRRGKNEQLTDSECLDIIGVVKLAQRTLNPIIKNSKFRKKKLHN